MKRPKRSTAEWVTLICSSTLLLVVFVLIGYSWATKPKEPPFLNVNYSIAAPKMNQFQVPFEVVNDGGETAEMVQVIAELRINGEIVESGEQIVDFLSRKETQQGMFIFSRDPRQGDLRIRVASYKEP
jgi:uncharacterized protein (TIGR02588 family)